MQSTRKALIVFMRYPESGQVKSRLAASIGAGEAARLYERLVRRTLGVTSDLKRMLPEVDIFLFFTPENKKAEVQKKFAGPWELIPQKGAHLGEKMDLAIRRILASGYGRCILIGSDIADIEVDDILDAFRALEYGYTPLGPAKDGGFYLIGVDRPCTSVFEDTQWGTSEIYGRTLNLLLASGHKVIPLTLRRDIDRLEDLECLRDKPIFSDKLSVVVPTLSCINQLRPFLLNLENQVWPGDEIIVVQGGFGTDEPLAKFDQFFDQFITESADPSLTPAKAGVRQPLINHALMKLHTCTKLISSECFCRKLPAHEVSFSFKPHPRGGGPAGFRLKTCQNDGLWAFAGDSSDEGPIPLSDRIQWLTSPMGRGIQLNLGASAAKGNLLLFLHDDCTLPPQFPYQVRKISGMAGAALGCFKLRFDPSTPLLNFISGWANYRSRLLNLPYGDQGLFCRKETFRKAGGFKKRFLMEDVDFVRHCLKEGELWIVQEYLRTSPKRYMQKGILRASLQNHLVMLLYRLGIEDEKLHSIYYRK